MDSVSTPAPRRAALLLVAVSAIAVLTGCVEAPAPEPSTTPTATATNSPSPSPTATTPGAVGTPIDIACADLVDPDTVYSFNPNLALIGEWSPPAGSAGAQALADDGVTCQWVHESGASTMEVSVAHLDGARLTQLKSEASASAELVPTYGDEAYFSPTTGTATVFQGPYWLVVASPMFAEPGEPTEIIESVFAALPRG